MKKHRLLATAGLVVTLAALIGLLPLPHYVLCTFDVQARDAESVYVDVPGRLDKLSIHPGQIVQPGQELAQLSNLDLELQIAELEGRLQQYRMELESLYQRRFRDRKAGPQIPELQETIGMVKQELASKREDMQRLTVIAPEGGTVIPPPLRSKDSQPPSKLPKWTGSPLELNNVGAYLQESDLLCQIGNPQRLEAVLVIDQGDIEFVRTGQSVRIKLDSAPGTTLHSRVEEVAKINMKVAPKSLSNQAGGDMATRTDEKTGVQRPLSTSYQARAPLEVGDLPLQIGLRGQAKIYTGTQTIGQRIWRKFVRTFHFRL